MAPHDPPAGEGKRDSPSCCGMAGSMTPRNIHSLMRRCFYFGVSSEDGYRHLMKDGVLDEALAVRVIAEYVHTDEAIVYADSRRGALVPVAQAFSLIERYRSEDLAVRLQVVASDLSARVVIESIGVGVGERR